MSIFDRMYEVEHSDLTGLPTHTMLRFYRATCFDAYQRKNTNEEMQSTDLIIITKKIGDGVLHGDRTVRSLGDGMA